MRRKLSLFGVLVLVWASGAYADVPSCSPREIKSADDGYAAPDVQGRRLYHRDTPSLKPLFQLPPITYNRPLQEPPGPGVRLVLSAEGRVECIDPASRQSLMLTPQRRAALAGMDTWRFEPVRVAGKPVRAQVDFSIPEKIEFDFHEAMPAASLSDMSVTLERHGDWPVRYDSRLTVYGDGLVDYKANSFSDVVGHYSWRIAPATVSALFARLRKEDVWSAAGNWSAVVIDGWTQTLTLTIGSHKRVIIDRGGSLLGMPKAVNTAEEDIQAVANDLIHLTPEGVAILDREDFDFRSQSGADLVVSASTDPRVDEDAVLDLLKRGAPAEGGRVGPAPSAYGSHIVFHFAQSRHWSRVLAWLDEHDDAVSGKISPAP